MYTLEVLLVISLSSVCFLGEEGYWTREHANLITAQYVFCILAIVATLKYLRILITLPSGVEHGI